MPFLLLHTSVSNSFEPFRQTAVPKPSAIQAQINEFLNGVSAQDLKGRTLNGPAILAREYDFGPQGKWELQARPGNPNDIHIPAKWCRHTYNLISKTASGPTGPHDLHPDLIPRCWTSLLVSVKSVPKRAPSRRLFEGVKFFCTQQELPDPGDRTPSTCQHGQFVSSLGDIIRAFGGIMVPESNLADYVLASGLQNAPSRLPHSSTKPVWVLLQWVYTAIDLGSIPPIEPFLIAADAPIVSRYSSFLPFADGQSATRSLYHYPVYPKLDAPRMNSSWRILARYLAGPEPEPMARPFAGGPVKLFEDDSCPWSRLPVFASLIQLFKDKGGMIVDRPEKANWAIISPDMYHYACSDKRPIELGSWWHFLDVVTSGRLLDTKSSILYKPITQAAQLSRRNVLSHETVIIVTDGFTKSDLKYLVNVVAALGAMSRLWKSGDLPIGSTSGWTLSRYRIDEYPNAVGPRWFETSFVNKPTDLLGTFKPEVKSNNSPFRHYANDRKPLDVFEKWSILQTPDSDFTSWSCTG